MERSQAWRATSWPGRGGGWTSRWRRTTADRRPPSTQDGWWASRPGRRAGSGRSPAPAAAGGGAASMAAVGVADSPAASMQTSDCKPSPTQEQTLVAWAETGSTRWGGAGGRGGAAGWARTTILASLAVWGAEVGLALCGAGAGAVGVVRTAGAPLRASSRARPGVIRWVWQPARPRPTVSLSRGSRAVQWRAFLVREEGSTGGVAGQ